MALTIRSLSFEAEKTLEYVLENNEDINANTKAIDFVLSDYLKKCEALKQLEQRNGELRRELIESGEDMRAIIKGFRVINKMIEKDV